MLVDIFITYKDREELFEKSLKSFIENTPRDLYRLTIVCDNGRIPHVLAVNDYAGTTYLSMVDHILVHKDNLGLGPSINQALGHIDVLNRYYADDTSPDNDRVTDFICYCQDDLLYSPKWLEKMLSFFCLLENEHNLGFASGVECVEHEVRENLGRGLVLKDYIRAAQMFARREYWMSMWPIPRHDPETGQVRAHPHNGMGSGADWYFIRNHPNSVCETGKTCLVIPGLVKHMGYKEST